MSIKRTTAVWEHSAATANNLLGLLAIADYADDDGFAWPGIETIAARARVSERTVYRLLDRLQAAGELYIEHCTGRGHTNQYLVLPGLSDEEIARTLERRFGKRPEEVEKILDSIRRARRKGDGLTPLKGSKGDSDAETVSTVQETVSTVQESVTLVTGKGVTGVTRIIKESSCEPSLEPSVVGAPPARPPATDHIPADLSPLRQTNTGTTTTDGPSPPGSAPPSSPTPAAVQIHLDWIRDTYDRSRRQWPNRAQREQIAREVTDLERWRRNLQVWGLKGYSSGKVDGQLDFYHRDEAEQERLKPASQAARRVGPEEAKKSPIDLRFLKPIGTGGRYVPDH